MSRPTLAERAGVAEERAQDMVFAGARAEHYVAELLGGRRVGHYAGRLGDVELLPRGELVEVKAITVPEFRCFGMTDYRPQPRWVLAVLVLPGEPMRLLGAAPSSAWRRSLPPLPNARPCWWAPASAISEAAVLLFEPLAG